MTGNQEKKYSTSWKRSRQPRKQRRFSYNAPLHLRGKKVHLHLSPELRKRHGFRSIQVRREDKVKVLRGWFAGKEGKVEKGSLRQGKVYRTGIEVIKKDGTKRLFPLPASHLMIIDLSLGDRKRKKKLESKAQGKITEKSKAK